MLYLIGIFIAVFYLCVRRNYIKIDYKAIRKDAPNICDGIALFIIKELFKSFLG